MHSTPAAGAARPGPGCATNACRRKGGVSGRPSASPARAVNAAIGSLQLFSALLVSPAARAGHMNLPGPLAHQIVFLITVRLVRAGIKVDIRRGFVIDVGEQAEVEGGGGFPGRRGGAVQDVLGLWRGRRLR